MKEVEQFAVGVGTICLVLMRGVGVIDDLFSKLMNLFGVYDPHWQLGILLVVLVFYVVLSLRAVGGMLGWAMLFFAVLLLLHRTIPSLSAPDTTMVAPALQNAL
jgi:hypothetical protein